MKLSSDGGCSGCKKREHVYGGVWRESGVWNQEIGFYCCVWQKFGFSPFEDVLTFNLLCKHFYKLCTIRAICGDNAAINCFHSRQL
jgi:hypothetical protein